MADTISIPLADNPVDLLFADDNPKLFRPGLNYTVKVYTYIHVGHPDIILYAQFWKVWLIHVHVNGLYRVLCKWIIHGL